MSATPHTPVPNSLDRPVPMTLPRLAEKKRLGEPIVMVTAYDYPSAQVAQEAGVDIVLVGDSGAMTVLGYPSTVPVSTRRDADAGRRRAPRAAAPRCWSATCPSAPTRPPTSRRSPPPSASSRRRAVTPSSWSAAATSVQRAQAIVAAGIPVMGHVGLTPQTATALGGYRAQGRTADQAIAVARDAIALEEAGCFSIVLEAIPAAVAEEIMAARGDPGDRDRRRPATDGQVLVFHDLLGIYDGHVARFAKRFADVRAHMVAGVAEYAAEVRSRALPGARALLLDR